MNRFLFALMAAIMLLINGNTYAEENGGLPEIAGYDDEAIEPLADRITADEVVAEGVASEEMPADVSDNGSLPEIAAYDDATFDALPATVNAQ